MAPSLMLTKMPMTPFRVMALVAGVAAICLVFSALTTTGRQPKLGAVFEQPSLPNKRDISGRTMADPNFWRTFDFQSEKIPGEVTDAAPRVKITNSTINIMGSNTFYLEAQQPQEGITSSGEVVVLLHGAAFQAKTWLDLKTINLLAAMGHHVIAIDLPGYGETKGELSGDAAHFLQSFISSFKVTQPVLVSPSMSGGFSIPFILKYPGGLSGYVPVAPVSTKKIVQKAQDVMWLKCAGFGHSGRHELGPDLRRTWLQSFFIALDLPPCIVVSPSFSGVYSLPMLALQSHELDAFVSIAVDATDEVPVHFLQNLMVPTLIIYGEKDQGLGHTSRDDLLHIPSSQAVELPGAKHPAYLDQPDMFHTLLYNFIKQVHTHRASA